MSGSRVLGLTGVAVAKEFCNGPELWPRRRLDRVMEANDGNRAFYRPQYSGVCHSHRCLALIFSVLGLATTSQTRSDIKHQLGVR